MELKIELKNIESQFIEDGKIITNENGKKIEYIIKNNVIVEVNPYDETRIANVESPTPKTDVDRVKGIISLEKVGVLDEIAEKNRDLIAQRLAEEKEVDEAVGDDRTTKIERLKKAIEKLESETKE